jgi:hypothetical protein
MKVSVVHETERLKSPLHSGYGIVRGNEDRVNDDRIDFEERMRNNSSITFPGWVQWLAGINATQTLCL